jgi:hypothetical protein
MEELQRRREELNSSLREVRLEAKREKQKGRDTKKSEASAWRLSTALLHTLLIIYSLAGYTAEPAVKFLAVSGRKRRWPFRSDDALQVMVEDQFLQVDADHLACLTDLDDPVDAAAMRQALSYVEQWRLFAWVERLNSELGVAPSTDFVLRRLEENRMHVPEDVRPRAVGSVADGRARQWARRFRRRWGGRHGSIKVREVVPLPELLDKVAPPPPRKS